MANSTSARKLNWMSSVFCRSETILSAVRTQVRALRPTGVREHQRSCGHPQLRLGSAPLHRGTKGKQKNCPTTPYLIGVACLYAYLRGLPPQHPLQTPVTEQLPRGRNLPQLCVHRRIHMLLLQAAVDATVAVPRPQSSRSPSQP